MAADDEGMPGISTPKEEAKGGWFPKLAQPITYDKTTFSLGNDGTVIDNEGNHVGQLARSGRSLRFNPPAQPRPLGPTCRWFGPSRGQAAGLFAEAGPDWPYDQLFDNHGCGNPINNRQGITSCQYYKQQDQCPLYEQAPVQLLAARKNPETDAEIHLRATRFGLGQPRYQIVMHSPEADDETLLHNLDNADHNGNANDVAAELFAKATDEHAATEVLHIEPERRSYLAALVAAHG